MNGSRRPIDVLLEEFGLMERVMRSVQGWPLERRPQSPAKDGLQVSQGLGGAAEDAVQLASDQIDEYRRGCDGLQELGRQAAPVDDVDVGRAASLLFDATESRQWRAEQAGLPIKQRRCLTGAGDRW